MFRQVVESADGCGSAGITSFDLHGRTQTDLELQTTGLAVSRHQMERFYLLFRELDVTPASALMDLPGGTDVLVAGVRRATNTPPMRNGRRTVFVTLDDGTGLTNLVFFPDARERIKNKVFRTNYMLVRGTTRRSGAKGISVTGHMAWDLLALPPRPDVRTQQYNVSSDARFIGDRAFHPSTTSPATHTSLRSLRRIFLDGRSRFVGRLRGA